MPSLSFCILHKDQPWARHFLHSTHPGVADLPPEKAKMVQLTLKTQGILLPKETHSARAGGEGFPVFL